ncbi:hypothetical protein ETB97_003395 [Aspergillus alliaceus]|uniref:Uncharacterized protein n=1 Tax=Petromyces alliaceus TaxID=209559 RepID=A0A8H6AEG0_PETAA|nr:hypothetical protein ETB97_003395 [Aspergillus burnettii]
MAKFDRKIPVKSASAPLSSLPGQDDTSSLGMSNHIAVITWSSFVVTVPILALTVTLLVQLIALADTWLHLTTTSMECTQVTPYPDSMAYSFGLIPDCLTKNNSVTAQTDSGHFCSINLVVPNTFLEDETTSMQALNGTSNEVTVSTYGNTPTCKDPRKCHLENNAAIVHYNFPDASAGDFTQTGLQKVFFTNASMNAMMGTSMYDTGAGNPILLCGGRQYEFGCTTELTTPSPGLYQPSVTRLRATSGRRLFHTSETDIPPIQQTAGAATFSAQPNSRRETLLVARTAKAPLITLVVVSLLYTSRLSIAGLVADRFEDSPTWTRTRKEYQMFDESSGKPAKRVAVESPDSDGAYRLTTWTSESGSTLQ